ncbi:molybdenum cofactor guanylyltransferase [Marinomonas rhizomae]|uniref:Molybdenum cofactor guanylyltransferase n=1 Tax=Marinomonas rhizomae TaxID=491948 RepID=A0A366JCR1_9GAMM|nr:molybdenum cofactor guanylyltransferase [Marinomonas rhizomae]RBP84200.1 molybdenum cofactor guanylyltransferase [Marinomonas rhizomae]RNF74529.1 molybdenum cofactor guanylyltransferase [Marinomonas rhizomae]
MAFISLSAAVLSGGKAERMSRQDKGLLLFQNEPMALSVGRALQQVSDCVFINANRNLEAYAKLGFEVVADDQGYQGKGPLSGLLTCLAFVQTTHLLISPCDTPRISAEAFEELKEAALSNPEKICYLSGVSGTHPLHAILPVEHGLAALKYFLDQGQRYSVLSFYEWFGCQSVVWENGEELLNVNTPDELV